MAGKGSSESGAVSDGAATSSMSGVDSPLLHTGFGGRDVACLAAGSPSFEASERPVPAGSHTANFSAVAGTGVASPPQRQPDDMSRSSPKASSTNSSGAATPGAEAAAAHQAAASRRDALANLAQVHAQLSSKVALLRTLVPRLSGEQARGGGSRTGEARAAAALAAAAAALAAVGTRAAEAVGAAGGVAGAGGEQPVTLPSDGATHANLVLRMETIHTQLRSICSEIFPAVACGDGGGDAGPADAPRVAAAAPHSECSWGSASSR
jgi:hypothetical protein